MPSRGILRANRTVLAIPYEYMPDDWDNAINDPSDGPTTAQLNLWAGINTQAGLGAVGGNISCSIEDSSVTLGLAESDRDSEQSICSRGDESVANQRNPEAALTFFRDADLANNSVENLSFNLFNAPDIKYVLVDRIQSGRAFDDAFQVGDVINMIGVKTDNPVDVKDDQANLKLEQNFVPTGEYAINFTLVA